MLSDFFKQIDTWVSKPFFVVLCVVIFFRVAEKRMEIVLWLSAGDITFVKIKTKENADKRQINIPK